MKFLSNQSLNKVLKINYPTKIKIKQDLPFFLFFKKILAPNHNNFKKFKYLK
jgi:hypothetical protein